jgi:membrane associated rhomboid family serine protease
MSEVRNVESIEIEETSKGWVPVMHAEQRKWLLRRLPYYTMMMFIIYTSIYFTICKSAAASDQGAEARMDALELDTRYAQDVYRWYTYSLLHLTDLHYGINMFCLWVYCGLVEYGNGPWRSCIIHICSILGGAYGIGWEGRITGERLRVIGASGGNYGLLSSQIANLILNWWELTLYNRIIYTSLIIGCVTSDIVINAVWYNPAVSYSGHVGGFVFGIFAGLAWMRNQRVLRWELRLRIISGIIFAATTIAGGVNLLVRENP